jgi:hypothetical protein
VFSIVIQCLAISTGLHLASKGNHIHADLTFKPSTNTENLKEEDIDM